MVCNLHISSRGAQQTADHATNTNPTGSPAACVDCTGSVASYSAGSAAATVATVATSCARSFMNACFIRKITGWSGHSNGILSTQFSGWCLGIPAAPVLNRFHSALILKILVPHGHKFSNAKLGKFFEEFIVATLDDAQFWERQFGVFISFSVELTENFAGFWSPVLRKFAMEYYSQVFVSFVMFLKQS